MPARLSSVAPGRRSGYEVCLRQPYRCGRTESRRASILRAEQSRSVQYIASIDIYLAGSFFFFNKVSNVVVVFVMDVYVHAGASAASKKQNREREQDVVEGVVIVCE